MKLDYVEGNLKIDGLFGVALIVGAYFCKKASNF